MQLELPTWKAVVNKFGELAFSVKKLQSLIEVLPKLTLTAAADEKDQGWFVKDGKQKVVHPHITGVVLQAQAAKHKLLSDSRSSLKVVSHHCLTL